MGLNDEQLKEQLAPGPLTRNGFDEKLRRRIEDLAEERNGGRPGGARRFALRYAMAAFAIVLVAAAAIWQWGAPGWRSPSGEAARMKLAGSETPAAYGGTDGEGTKPSALLIGLRTDRKVDGHEINDYRTLLIGPLDGSLQVIAQGTGIYMPYKKDFWRVVAFPEPDGRQVLQAYLANGIDPDVAAIPEGLRTQKLLYAGNRYLSMLETYDGTTGGAARSEPYAVGRVREITQLKRDTGIAADNPVLLADVLGPEASIPAQNAGRNWIVARKSGKWIAESHDNDPYAWQALPDSLPAAVVSHDELTVPWNEILRVEPKAKDAFTSPAGDMVAIVLGDRIRVYPADNGVLAKTQADISLSSAETVVMSQWATGNYVNAWEKTLSGVMRR